jgi:putative phosphoribosyl transferase
MAYSGQFQDRTSAGKALARKLLKRQLADPVVMALPRGGVAVGVEIARALGAPIDLVFVRKIGVPYQTELAAAAVVDGGEAEIIVNEDVVMQAGVSRSYIEEQAKKEVAEIERRRQVYLEHRPRVVLEGKTLIVVDDGIATGASMRAALKALRRKNPKTLVLAVPVAPARTMRELSSEVDEIICLREPEPFFAIGLHYRDFHQIPDEEVVRLLTAADQAQSKPSCAERERKP